MKKEYRKMVRKGNGKIREIKGGQVTIEVPLPITEVLMETTEVVENIGREIRLMVISAITALLRAKSKFRRVRGYKEIPQLLAVLHNLSFGSNVSVKLQGGYDGLYVNSPSSTTINGTLTIYGETVIMENIVIQ